MDHPVPLPRDLAMRVANHAEGERLRKAKEDKKRNKRRKLQAWELREDTDDDDDDDDGDDDEVMEEEETVADNIEWDNLENKDALIGIGSSLQASRPFPFHGGEGTSRELVEAGHSDDAPQEPMEAGHIVVLPYEPTEAGGSTVVPEVPAEAGGFIVTPKS